MKANVFIDNDMIGSVDFQIIDESMGVIGGDLLPDTLYEKYKPDIQDLYNRKGIANSNDYHFKITISDNIIKPEGGIGITDSSEFNEIYIEAGGLNSQDISKLK